MRKKILKISFIICISLFVLCISNTISNAASFDASISKTSVKVGDTFIVTIKANNAAGNYSVSASNSKVTLISGNATEFLENNSTTLTYKAVTAGTVNIVAKATDMTDLDNSSVPVTGSKTFTVTISEPSTGGNTGGTTGGNTGGSTGGTTSGGNTTTTPTKPTFKDVSKTVYATGDINLRASWSTSSAATKVEKGTELRLTGTSTEKVNGYVWYRVTYNGQIKYVAKDLVTETKPEEEKSNNANLKTLSVEGVELSPEFSADVTEYSVKLVDFEGNELKVTAEAEDEKSTVKVEGNTNIENEENIITVTVTAEDGTTKIYTITAVKESSEAFGLTSLTIKDVEIKGFSTEKYEYKVEFEALDKLEIEAIATEEGATIEILGNENLVEGENLITIMVTSADGTKTATYQIKATKLLVAVQEETREINMKAVLISALIALVVLVIIIILISKYVKNNSIPVVDYEYHDNLENNKQDNNDTEFASKIRPETEVVEEKETRTSRVDELFAEDIEDETPRRRGRGKHSK